MNNIAKAFVAAKREFAPALKTSTNPHFRSKYADLSGCLEAVNDALLNHGIALYQETSEDDTGVTVETVFLHESGESLRGGKLHVPAGKQDPQGYGSALTYARRYSVMAACGIAAEDDDGNAASKPKTRNTLDSIAPPRDANDLGLYVPGKEEPYSLHSGAAKWLAAFKQMMGSLETSDKYETRMKMTKMREFKEANQAVIEQLGHGEKALLDADYNLRLKRLGASLGDQ